jgi:hypothetical protein
MIACDEGKRACWIKESGRKIRVAFPRRLDSLGLQIAERTLDRRAVAGDIQIAER